VRPLALAAYVSITISVLTGAELGSRSPVPGVPPGVHDHLVKARTFLATGEYANAERSLRLALVAAADDPESNRTVRTALADLLREEGRGTESRQFYTDVLNASGATVRQKLDSYAGLADLDGMAGKTELASGEWEQAITLARGMKNELAEADALRGLSTTWLDAGNPSRAEPLLRRALKMLENNPAAQSWAIASVLTNLGRCYRMEDKLALSEDALTRAFEMQRKTFGDGHPQVAFVMERLAEVYSLRNQFAMARDYSAKALLAMKAACGENSAAVAAALLNRAGIEHRANALNAAADNYAAALKIAQSDPRIRADNAPLELQIIERYSMVLKATHRDREAKELSALARSFRGK
jgi:hypothetical protein